VVEDSRLIFCEFDPFPRKVPPEVLGDLSPREPRRAPNLNLEPSAACNAANLRGPLPEPLRGAEHTRPDSVQTCTQIHPGVLLKDPGVLLKDPGALGPPGPLKGPRGPFKGPRGPLKGTSELLGDLSPREPRRALNLNLEASAACSASSSSRAASRAAPWRRAHPARVSAELHSNPQDFPNLTPSKPMR